MSNTKKTSYNRIGHLISGEGEHDSGDLNSPEKKKKPLTLPVFTRLSDSPFGPRLEYVDARTMATLYVVYLGQSQN